jgi:hypothetical protein
MDAILPEPEVLSCFFDDQFLPHLPAMYLDWKVEAVRCRLQSWKLPLDVLLTSAAPTRFGIEVRRYGRNDYSVRLLWNDSRFCWDSLSREQLLDTSLPSLLSAMGTDMRYLLEQPIEVAAHPAMRLKAG